MGALTIKPLQFLADRLTSTPETTAELAERIAELDGLIQQSVSVVGNASSLLSRSFGQQIDCRQTIRFNSAQIVAPDAQGERWDLLATSNRATLRYYRESPPRFSRMLFTAYKNRHLVALEEIGASVPVTLYPMRMSRDLSWRLRARPTVGMQVLVLLAALKRADVHIFGFDWKATPTFYDPERGSDPHRHDRERALAAELIESNGWTVYT
ncbi:MAG: hypothetical protein QM702_11000 [Rubrivivax sp.]